MKFTTNTLTRVENLCLPRVSLPAGVPYSPDASDKVMVWVAHFRYVSISPIYAGSGLA